MPVHNIDDVKAEALEQLRKEDFEHAVKEHKKVIQAKKKHFFSKKMKLQWPIRFEAHYQPLNRRHGDKGKTQ